MGFAGALSSVGIEAEAGGSAFSKVMIEMQLATETQSKSLEDFAKVAGMTGEEFTEAFQTNAAGAMIEFIDGLSKAEEQGTSAIKVLDDMGITEIRMRDALLRASGASDVFTKSLEIGTTAWDENNALTKEAEQRYGTTASQIEIAKNKMADAGITIGEVLAPHLITLAEKVADVAEWFGSLNPETQESIIKMAALAATIGPVLSVAGSLTSGLGSLFGTVSKVTKGVGTFSKAIQGGSTVIGALGTALGPGGLVILGMAAFATAAVLIYKNWDKITAAVSGAINRVKEFFGVDKEAQGAEGKYNSYTPASENIGGRRNAINRTSTSVIDSSISVGTRWNAEGGIFTKPTVLPTIAGWQGFGEAGAEAILPLSKLDGMLSGGSQTVNHTGTITVRGVNNRDELVAVIEQKITDGIVSGNRRLPNRTSLIPI